MPTIEPMDKKAPQEPAKFVKGLEGIVAGQTVLSLVDGENSKLYYRGIPVHEFTENSTYEETVFYLWTGQFPNSGELKSFQEKLASYRKAPKEILDLIQRMPKKAQPMAVLRTLASAMGLYDPNADKIDLEITKQQAYLLTGVFPTLIAAFHRHREGKPFIEPDAKLSHAANFLYMMHGTLPSKEMERAMDAYLILLADHGFNASTFSARVTASTQADTYSAITSAIGTLKGDLHGSANQKAMEMILEIGSPEKAEPYVRNLLSQHKKVMGFGHRIYKKEDPRATAFRKIADDLCQRSGHTKWMEISNIVEKLMWSEKQIPCNVDFFSASVLHVLGFPVDFFTTVFAASRVAGWTAHVIEQRADNRLIRPSADYVGPSDQHYVPKDKRK